MSHTESPGDAATRRPASEPPRRASRALGKRPRMMTFMRVLTIMTVVTQLIVWAAVSELTRLLGWPVPWLWGLLVAVVAVAVFRARTSATMNDRRRSKAVLRLLDIPFYVHWCAGLFAVPPTVVATVVSPVLDLVRGQPLGLPRRAYMIAYFVGLALSAYGILIRRRWFVVRRVEVPVAGLDPKLDGLRVAHLSDMHIGAITPRTWGERWARAANAADPDLTVITGDMVTSGVEFHEDIAAVIGQLRARLGVFTSMGNHDYFGEGEPLISLLGAGGATVLRNQGRVIERDGGRFYLAAIDDTWTRRDDMQLALADRPSGMATVLLAHDPDRFVQAAELGVNLTLSGHTHGGQVAMPFFYRHISLSHLTHRFHIGLYNLGAARLYVHPGLGTTGPPIRLGIAPAVVVLTLRAA